LLCRHDMA